MSVIVQGAHILADELRQLERKEIEFGSHGKSREARELEARIGRETELKKMERQVTLQLQLMGKGRARKMRKKEASDDESVPVYKWKPQRQK